VKKYNQSVIGIVLFVLILWSISSISSFLLSSVDITSAVSGNMSTIKRAVNSSSPITNTVTDKVRVVSTFYPIFEFVKQIGGDRVEVSSLIPIGIEPHDYEPTIQQIQNAETADMLVINGAGFEEGWIKNINTKFLLDTSVGLNLTDDQGGPTGDNKGNGEALINPHIWLDPLLAKQQVEKIRVGLINVDPTNAAYYNENAKRFITELNNLDSSITSGLSNCEKRDFIAFHDAFSYFADRYGLTQHSIHGVSPEADVLPQRLQQIVILARDTGLDTIYSEELVDPRFANVIAQEIPNGKVLVLSPIEGIDKEEQNAGVDYLDKMEENIENLKIGLKCN
jgi:zinc transport system substrate-binding protein